MQRTKLVPRNPHRRGKQLATREAREVPKRPKVKRPKIKVDAEICNSDDEAEAHEVSVHVNNY